MRRRLSSDDLDRMAARCTGATTGPWIAYVEGRDHESGDSFIRLGSSGTQQTDLYVARFETRHYAADLDLIAHARSAIPQLIAAAKTGTVSDVSADEIAELSGLLRSATPGPWTYFPGPSREQDAVTFGEDSPRSRARLLVTGPSAPDPVPASPADYEFVAACRMDLEALLKDAFGPAATVDAET